jgi:cephalosporin hydroxylase
MKMDNNTKFLEDVKKNIQRQGKDIDLKSLSRLWMRLTAAYKYSYNFTWLGRPIIQFPQDILAIQEIIWRVEPDLIIETGIAHGGSLILHASILELLNNNGEVVGIDVDLRKHNKLEIEKHPLFKRITLIDGSSTDENTIGIISDISKKKNKILVILDSNHDHQHVLNELRLYEKFVCKGSYIIVFDTIIEFVPEDFWPNRSWSVGNNPKTAVDQFLKENDRFAVDTEIENKLLITTAPGGYLKCIKN